MLKMLVGFCRPPVAWAFSRLTANSRNRAPETSRSVGFALRHSMTSLRSSSACSGDSRTPASVQALFSSATWVAMSGPTAEPNSALALSSSITILETVARIVRSSVFQTGFSPVASA